MKRLSTLSPAPIHRWSSITVIILDFVWSIIEFGATFSIVGVLFLIPLILVSGLSCVAVVGPIQRFVAQDEWRPALIKGSAVGIAVAIPYFFVGLGMGLIFLGWDVLHQRAQQ